MAGPKADKLTTEQRTEAVYRLILDGWSVDQIVENGRKSWRIKDAMIYRYIDKAWQRIEAVAAPQREEHLNRAVAAGYQMLREAKTVKEKMAVWSFMARLLGLNAPERTELTGRDGGPVATEIIIKYADDNDTTTTPRPAPDTRQREAV